MKTKGFIVILLLISVFACRINKTTHVKVTDAYQPEQLFDRLKVSVWHVSHNTTRLYLLIDTRNLLYKKELFSQRFKADYKIHYEYYDLVSPKIVVDSLTVFYADSLNYTDREIILDSLDIHLPAKGKFVMQMKLTDLNSQTENIAYINLDNISNAGRQNFLMKKTDGSILFQPFLENPANPFFLKTNNIGVPRLFVRYYKQEYPIALPPFIDARPKSFSFRPDSVFFIELTDGTAGPLQFPAKGIYHIQSDTSIKEGATFFSFYKGFPEVTNAAQMLFPLRYICSKTEFNDMMLMKNSKEAVDDFWLDIAGNPDRAKELIRKYYSRVETANTYFTSYHEGWKTDRGMIYIIFGAPGIVYRNPDGETWIYGEDRNILSMTLNFSRVDNPFSDNDFELDRSLEYKDTWYSAIEAWRN